MSDTRKPVYEPAAEGETRHKELAPEIVEGEADTKPPEEARPRARLLPMWILIAAVVVVGVAWALSDRYLGESETAETDVPLVTAEETPVKVRPKEPGGVEVPDRDKYVYKSLTEEEPDVEQLLPPPEEPMELSAASVDKGMDAPTEAAAVAAETVEVSKSTSEADIQVAPDTSPDKVTFADPETLVSESKNILPNARSEEAEPVSEAAASTARGETVAALAQQADEPEPGTVSEPEPEFAPKLELEFETVPEPVKIAALSADTPGVLLQIGATQQEDRAAGEITRLVKKHPEILGGLGSIVVRIDLGEKGVWYRMRVGPFASRAEAEVICGELKVVNVGCFVVAE